MNRIQKRIALITEKAKHIYRKQRAKFIGINWYQYNGKQTNVPANNRFKIISDYDEFLEFICRHTMNNLKQYRERFYEGDKFACLFDENNALSYGWICTRESFYVSEIDKTVTNAGTVVLYDCVTPEQFRNKGYYSEILRQVGNYYSLMQMDVFVFALKNNKPSIRALEKVGFKKSHYKVLKT